MNNQQLHESGLNIIQNEDGSFAFEWDPKDTRWSWLNTLTDEEVKVIMEEEMRKKLEELGDDT